MSETRKKMCISGKENGERCVTIWNPTVKIGAREDHDGIKVRSEGLRTTQICGIRSRGKGRDKARNERKHKTRREK